MNKTTPPPADTPAPRPAAKKPWWRKALKITAVTLGSLIALILLLITLAVWILTPARLTPLVEKYASDYMNASLTASRIELSFWSTFPEFRVDIDSLSIISHALDSLPAATRATLPPAADSLLAVDHLDAAIHIPRLLTGEIALTDIAIVRPRVNLLQAAPAAANFDIFPPSSEPADTTSSPLPDISIGSFTLIGDAPVTYTSIPDSLDVTLNIASTAVKADGKPAYRLQASARARARVARIVINDLRLGLGGRIIFDPRTPSLIEVRGLRAGIGDLIVDTDARFNADPRRQALEELKVDVPRVRLNSIIALIPRPMRDAIPSITTDMTVAASMQLTRPFYIGVPGADTIPSFKARAEIDASTFRLDKLDLSALALKADATVDGHNPDASTVNITTLKATGRSVAVELTASATSLLSDPLVHADFHGSVDFGRLPAALMARLPFTVAGTLKADLTADTRLSWLNPDHFHRVRLAGSADLAGLRAAMRDGSASLAARHADLRLGSSDSFVRDDTRIDSLLTASLKVDTITFLAPGYHLGASRLAAGIGCSNRATSSDTSLINPIGATFRIGRLNYMSEADTMRLRMRDVAMRASLARWQGNARAPKLTLNIDAARIRWADRFNRASLADGSIALLLHPRATVMSPRMAAAVDSLRRLYPSLPADSLRRMAVRSAIRRRGPATPVDSLDRRENIDMQVDGSTRRLLRRWDASGSLRAARARVMTPYFPLRCVLRNLDIAFNTDSVAIRSASLTAGKSDFSLSGSIANINRALTSRRGAPLRLTLELTSNHIDINELASAAFAGSAFADAAAAGNVAAAPISDSDDDDAVEASVSASTDATGPLLVPSNVDADLYIKAGTVAYSDVALNDLRGTLRVHDGALNLDNLSATSDIGSVNFTALYSAPTRRDLNFAFGMNLKDFHISKFLDLMPAVDSIMPLLRDISGIINAEIVATSALEQDMSFRLPSLTAAMKISGDSLVFLDAETFRVIGKWLLFKNKSHNMVDHMSVQLAVRDSRLDLYPFMFDIDRYRLGVLGGNDLAMNYKYHVSVLKSPVPFKFGINISGNPDKMKVRLGGAKFKENMAATSTAISDTTRINLIRDIRAAFRRGVSRGKVAPPRFATPAAIAGDEASDTISHADSLIFIREGLIPAPPAPPAAPANSKSKK